ncbi:MAG: tRNA preQ1(34) S-adenosylmethionine ribosyltransferase-isomerase QueA [Actinobacteria bacterium]|nr:tRNA preQ1(34) S-adenosylmethionine ribosyltransferase-isomerase QueA [Actinomycetota bacterium]MBU1942102.1 tRNA preQ1(34) S-adenosylmethionine ribosyltransferase-isomerase QueA [Actinomycetota bacterium]MBU2687363.1 tRNA preQ1(34) S-adenosylmethionine ribosyltransferase-isomerase QueA [Actinomycetota bacterium]
MRTDLFDYPLPRDLIAQSPSPVRDESRLMLIERGTGRITHRVFNELPSLLLPGDLLVVNDTRVFPGRLKAAKDPGGGAVELLLLEEASPGTWSAMTRGARLRRGTVLRFDGEVRGEVLEGPREGVVTVRFEATGRRDIDEAVFARGEVPLPPYIIAEVPDPERYQTVYSRREISAAAPTAGLHFTRRLLERVVDAGARVTSIELAVGRDTFVPVREESIEDHRIHSEWFGVGRECALAVEETRRRGGRVVAVGTTVVRALESAAGGGDVRPTRGRTDLFIAPGYGFRAVDALLTNFHFPRSTLLMLVCAFGGRDLILEAYSVAVAERYRFYSFGDAMLIT